MNKFKNFDHSSKDDDFTLNVKKILEMKEAKMSGSYLRYGRENACDLDLSENLNIDKSEINDLLKKYLMRLKEKEKEIILIRLSFDIIDESIKKLLDKLGNLNGLLQIENSNINEDDVNNKLPKKMVKTLGIKI